MRADTADATTASIIAARVVDRLLRLCRYQTILDLTSPASDLDRTVEVDLLAGPAGWTEGDRIPTKQQLSPLAREVDFYPVKDGQAVFLRIANQGSQPINVAAVDLSCRWGIDLLVPAEQTGARSEVIGANETRLFPIIMFLPQGFSITPDIFKVFAAVGNAPFASLKQPSIDQPFGARGAQRGVHASALGRLFDAFDADANTMRSARPAMSRDLAWTVRTFRLQVTSIR